MTHKHTTYGRCRVRTAHNRMAQIHTRPSSASHFLFPINFVLLRIAKSQIHRILRCNRRAEEQCGSRQHWQPACSRLCMQTTITSTIYPSALVQSSLHYIFTRAAAPPGRRLRLQDIKFAKVALHSGAAVLRLQRAYISYSITQVAICRVYCP